MVKSSWLICLWLLSSLCGFSQVAASRLPSPGEAVCGYAASFQRVEPGRRRSGLSVELLAGDAIVNQPLPLRFRVVQKPQEIPVDDLQIEHEKHIHVIGVRDDLGELIHLHPQRTSPGLWEIIHTFTNAGRYQIWSDVKHRGTVYSFAHPRLTVPSLQEPFLPPQGFGLAHSKTLTRPSSVFPGSGDRFSGIRQPWNLSLPSPPLRAVKRLAECRVRVKFVVRECPFDVRRGRN